jgi:hypothetical protein
LRVFRQALIWDRLLISRRSVTMLHRWPTHKASLTPLLRLRVHGNARIPSRTGSRSRTRSRRHWGRLDRAYRIAPRARASGTAQSWCVARARARSARSGHHLVETLPRLQEVVNVLHARPLEEVQFHRV